MPVSLVVPHYFTTEATNPSDTSLKERFSAKLNCDKCDNSSRASTSLWRETTVLTGRGGKVRAIPRAGREPSHRFKNPSRPKPQRLDFFLVAFFPIGFLTGIDLREMA